jgi:uncharacterized linocin/CFP29 family protein
MSANVDFVGAGGATQGAVASRLQANGQLNLGAMRPFFDEKTGACYITMYKGGDVTKETSWQTVPFPRPMLQANATLRRDEWKKLDEALLVDSRYRLGGIEDLRSKGLTFNLGNAMGTTVLEWHDVGDAMKAIVSMDGVTRGPNDRPNYQYNYLPIPIIHVDYEINARELALSRNMGNPLDTTEAEMAARRINETLEDMLFTDTTFAFGETDSRGRNKIYSYVNHPDRNTVHLSIPWDHSAITAAGILQDVQDMKAAAGASRHYGPYMLYIPTAYERVMDDDYSTVGQSVLTIRERILKLGGITGIKVIDTLTTDNVLLVQMTPDVVRLVNGMGIQNVEWATEGNMLFKYKAMAIAVPQIRSEQSGRSGVTHMA